MTKNEMDMDAYREEMFECRANGIGTCSFAEWKRQRDAFYERFMSIDVKLHDQRQIDLDRGK